MAAPTSVPDLLDLIRRSGLMDAARMERVATNCSQAPVQACPVEFLDQLVVDGLLTRFQAEQFAQGRWQGFTVGHYRILSRIGAGGMSQVFLAESPHSDTRVAVKVLSPRLATDPVARERFAREATAMAALSHPNIVRVLDVDANTAIPYLVMEYIDGISLQAAVARHGTFSAGSTAYCGRQVALGLQRAYEVGLVHRDIKPANILIDRTGAAKILDMGIVRMSSDTHLTRRIGEKTILGTADYLAPEQAVNSSDVDSRADLYALGATLYFLLAGHPPFPNCTAFEKIVRKQKDDPEPIHRLRPDVPLGLSAVLAQLLARNPANRYPTPHAAATALQAFATLDNRFPACLFEPTREPIDELVNTPTNATDHNRTPTDGELLADPTTDIVSVSQPDLPTVEILAPATKLGANEPSTFGLWLAVGALAFAVAAITLLILVARGRVF